MNRAAKLILAALRTGGPRKANVLQGMVVRPGDPQRALDEYHAAIGQLFLGGFILTTGRTSGRLIKANGRRRT